MNGKYLIIGIVLLILLPYAFGLSIQTDKEDYAKGETIEITGNCNRQLSNKLVMTYGAKKIFEKAVDCTLLGEYSLGYKIDFLGPSGNWIIKLSAGEESVVRKIAVLHSPESAYYLVRFLSPSIGEYRRAEDVAISVKVTDAGIAVEDANVVCWDLYGNKIYLENKGNGLYSLQYEISYDLEAKEWDLLVIAVSEKDGKSFGGENSISLEITDAPILIDVIEPATQSFELTDSIPIKVAITYFNGKEIKEEREQLKAVVKINEKSYELEKIEKGVYQLNYKPESNDLGTLTVSFSAEDDAGNVGNKTINLVITCSLDCLTKTYGIYVLVLFVIVIIILIVSYSRIKYSIKLRALEKERGGTLDLIKSMQREYFEKKVMSYRAYKENLADYQTKIAELDEKIKNLKEKRKR